MNKKNAVLTSSLPPAAVKISNGVWNRRKRSKGLAHLQKWAVAVLRVAKFTGGGGRAEAFLSN